MMKRLLFVAMCMAIPLHGSFYFHYGNFPRVYKGLETAIADAGDATRKVALLAQVDAPNLASGGEKEALEWTRKYVARHPPQKNETYARDSPSARKMIFEYLAIKGDARDIKVVSQYNSDILAPLLKMRTEGINVFDCFYAPDDDGGIYLGWPSFFPSVDNTGPQAVYVREILYRFWGANGRDKSKIPQELLTMAVWFGEDGTPVCNVDLAEHGLSMPAIDPKPHRDFFNFWNDGTPHDRPSILTVAFPDLAEPVRMTPNMKRKFPEGQGLYINIPQKTGYVAPPFKPLTVPKVQPEKTSEGASGADAKGLAPPPSPLWLCIGIGILVCSCAIFYFMRRKPESKS